MTAVYLPRGSKYLLVKGTWVLGNSNHSTGFREVYDHWVLGPSGLGFILIFQVRLGKGTCNKSHAWCVQMAPAGFGG